MFNNISINSAFWFKFTGGSISFGFLGLPENVHFTISFEENNSDVNFHVSKNVTGNIRKPCIRIIEIDKKVLEDFMPDFSRELIRKSLTPLNIDELKNEYKQELRFVSYNNLEKNSDNSSIGNNFMESFKDITKAKKKRLKVTGDIGEKLKNFAMTSDLINLMNNSTIDLPINYEQPVDCGIIRIGEDSINVIRIYNQWYIYENNLTPFQILETFTNSKLAPKLLWKTKKAIISVKYANSFDDTKHLHNPIRLSRVRKKNEDKI